jgi:hypothetical protein
MAELLMNRPIFRGTKSSDQMEKIMRVLGSPSRAQIKAMNPDFRRELNTSAQRSLEEVSWALRNGRRSSESSFVVRLNLLCTKAPA